MQEEVYTHLCVQLREYCHHQHWYGGDLKKTMHWSEHNERYERYYAVDGTEIVIDRDPDDHPLKQAFVFPPATGTQLQETEMALGCSLPPVLRAVYTQVANGGFGPGYGVVGAMSGFDEAGTIVTNYRFHTARSELIDLADAFFIEKEMAPLLLPERVWPRFLLYLCDWGYATTSCIDARAGCIVRVRPALENHCYILAPEAPSLESWWMAWMRGQLQPATFIADSGSEEKEPPERTIRQVFQG